jgi:hypothetical protein
MPKGIYERKINPVLNLGKYAIEGNPWRKGKKLRLELFNGRTLCHNCHIKTENWGMKNKSHPHWTRMCDL